MVENKTISPTSVPRLRCNCAIDLVTDVKGICAEKNTFLEIAWRLRRSYDEGIDACEHEHTTDDSTRTPSAAACAQSALIQK